MDNNVREGDLVQVIYDGKNTLEKGPMKGKQAHSFVVNIAETEEQLTPVVGTKPEELMERPEAKKSVDLSDLD